MADKLEPGLRTPEMRTNPLRTKAYNKLLRLYLIYSVTEHDECDFTTDYNLREIEELIDLEFFWERPSEEE